MAKEGQARRPGPTGNELGRALTLLPTPRERDWKGEGYHDCLPNVVKLLPTPTADGSEGTQRNANTKQWYGLNSLGPLTRHMVTGSPSTGESSSPPSADGKPSTGLRLNPSFVGWMLGEPTCQTCKRGWTDPLCEHSAHDFQP
jgi:hypothetical protein